MHPHMLRHGAAAVAAVFFGWNGAEALPRSEGWWLSRSGNDSSVVRPSSMWGAPGRLVVWGGPLFGRVPWEVAGLPAVAAVAVSDRLCAAISQDGEVYAVQPSINRMHKTIASAGPAPPKDDPSDAARPDPQVVPLKTSIGRPVDVAIRAASSEIVVVDASGYVSVVAKAGNRNGTTDTENSSSNFEPGQILAGALQRSHIVKVRCGSQHCIAIDKSGEVYAWGDNSFRQLGLGASPPSDVVRAGSKYGNAKLADQCATLYDKPVRVPVPGNARIVDAACGDRHTVLLADDGAIYAAGDGQWAQLGITAEPWRHGGAGPVARMQRAECIADLAVCGVACGAGHTLTLVKDGTVFSFGANEFGQLGHHNFSSFAPPSPTADISLRAVAVRSGRNHSCVVTETGKVYCIGLGDAGQLGSGPLQRTAVWRKVRKLCQDAEPCHVASLAAGGDTTAAIIARD
jgi:Regulator of chromosome condensation (RCC1) repeat